MNEIDKKIKKHFTSNSHGIFNQKRHFIHFFKTIPNRSWILDPVSTLTGCRKLPCSTETKLKLIIHTVDSIYLSISYSL